MKLDERLSLCAQMVRDGAAVADIGTDHAYLPVYLVECGKIHKAIAADVREGPLENAKGNISKNGFDQQIKTVLSDGLEKISPDEADDIVIAGMGGELIIRIISAAAWLKDSSRHLILQPMTRAEQLREYLCSEGFKIVKEKACISLKKTYSVMLCEYDGKKRSCDDRYRYIGMLSEDNSPQAKRYIYVINEKLKKKLRGFSHGSDEYIRLERLIKEFDEMSYPKGGVPSEQCTGDI